MINYKRIACEAGFGGVLWRMFNRQIKSLIDKSREYERRACADLCTLRGQDYSAKQPTEFHDGQMDGAFSCAEIIMERR